MIAIVAGPVTAQERPGTAAEFVAGWGSFVDDGIVNEGVVGGSARWYLSPRIAVGPEALYVDGDGHSHVILTGNLTFDMVSAGGAQRRPVIPFVVAGVGLFQTRTSFTRGTYTSSEGSFTAGGGFRVRVGHRGLVGADVRVGWELHVRVNALVGWQFGSYAPRQ